MGFRDDTCNHSWAHRKEGTCLDDAAGQHSLQALALGLRGDEPVALPNQQQHSLPHILQLGRQLPALITHCLMGIQPYKLASSDFKSL